MSDIEMQRAFVTDLYSGPKWAAKVKKMPDAQVIAIYLREQGKPPKNDKAKENGSGETGGDDIPF